MEVCVFRKIIKPVLGYPQTHRIILTGVCWIFICNYTLTLTTLTVYLLHRVLLFVVL